MKQGNSKDAEWGGLGMQSLRVSSLEFNTASIQGFAP